MSVPEVRQSAVGFFGRVRSSPSFLCVQVAEPLAARSLLLIRRSGRRKAVKERCRALDFRFSLGVQPAPMPGLKSSYSIPLERSEHHEH